MINVKLLVLFVCIGDICECYSDYCRICASHTLCMYKNPGPGPFCKSYDKTAALTKDDVETIVSKINQRRNFVALGLARNLPSAANMNKMRWSEELAMSAQRWADQCDSAVRPDKKDLCRDLVDTPVGQNIATVTGVSPGLSVKSFVETWFMQALDYTGNVAYYNQSGDSKTEYFTQLIWAETKLVGCGKARFSIDDRGTMVDRFVCNFAPKGNVRGKPVYTIGYPATQCKEHSEKDEQFPGLCEAVPEQFHRTTTEQTESILRMINLPNNPVKQDIDPIRADSKNHEINQDVLNLMRHQNLRHIVPQHTRGIIHHAPPARLSNIQALPIAQTNYDVIARQRSTNYMQNIYGTMYKTRSPIEPHRRIDSHRRNDYASENHNDGANERRRVFSGQCSRHLKVTYNNDNECNEVNNQEQNYCTRGRKKTDYVLTTQPECRTTEKRDTCNTPKSTCIVNPTKTSCDYNYNCHCVSNPPPENHRRIPGEYVYYDYFPNLALRGGEEIEARHHPKNGDSFEITTVLPQDHDDNADNEYITHEVKSLGLGNQKPQRQPARGHRNKNRNYQNFYVPLNFAYPRERLKRQVETQYSDMPFWKLDRSDKRSQKRTPKYTTLRKINRKFKTTLADLGINTEAITITVSDFTKHRHDNTDKSLSFDELMYFRKNRGGEMNINMRRTDKIKEDAKTRTNAVLEKTNQIPKVKKATKNIPMKTNPIDKNVVRNRKIKSKNLHLRNGTKIKTTTKTTKTTGTTGTTTQMTLIGSFSPQSACTRRITCTWTAPIITDANGNELTTRSGGGGGGSDFPNGRTPWGYVENCTRRYTCSRLYYNRNVQASDTTDAGETTLPDEDYCERRALNVKRRDSYVTEAIQTLNHDENFTESTTIRVTLSIKDEIKDNDGDCSCDDKEKRDKRSLPPCKHREKKVQESKSKTKPSNNLYYLALGKILQMWENIKNRQKRYPNRCHCNACVPMQLCSCHLFIFLYVLYVLN